jgi:hypothetical protein
MEGIVFTIKRIIFHNDENGYTVVEGVNELNGNTFTAVCDNMLDPANGLKISAIGEWENSKHGKQFKFSSYKEEVIRSNQALIEYLGGGFFKGIGSVYRACISYCLWDPYSDSMGHKCGVGNNDYRWFSFSFEINGVCFSDSCFII